MLNDDKVVKDRLIRYSFALQSDNKPSDQNQKVPNLNTILNLRFNFVQKVFVLISQVQHAKQLLNDIKSGNTWKYADIIKRRENLKDYLKDDFNVIDINPQPGSADDIKFNN